MNTEIVKLLNSRSTDLDFELGVYLNLEQLSKSVTLDSTESTLSEMRELLLDKFSVDLEEIAEEEEISTEEITAAHINDALKYAREEVNTELKVYLTLERFINQLKNVGATESELSGLKDFSTRLEQTVYSRFSVSEEDLKELEGESDE